MNNQTTTQRLQPLSGGRKTRSAKQGTLAPFLRRAAGCGKEHFMIYMTRSDLERLNVLREDIRLEAEALKKLHGITPHTAEVIPLIKADMDAKRAQMEAERVRVRRYVDEIEDPVTRGIIEDHYLNGKPWYETAWNAALTLSTNGAWNRAMRYIYARCGLCAKKRGSRK